MARGSEARLAVALGLCAMTLAAAAFALPASAQTRRSPALVAAVVDGDTIDVLLDGQHERVRYIGMDTPETKHPSKPVQCFGAEASARNAELVADQWVELERDVSERDQYGRLLRYVWVGQTLVNAKLLFEGYAQVLT